ncbi:MAG TPA: prepilin-type N-terminal cleavage/methylation domain-containing protein [Rickettsiales bacterium]|nr:prepilin-type N-terminal cleavage/methylation domain-containing protein [Rickettsiales bacterium]
MPVQTTRGFTLIELSIVLVIIGLIVGGVLTGRDLIEAAANRAQIAQIEKYNTAVRAFQGKYGGIPGDLSLSLATSFGFQTGSCDGGQARRDGNGLLEGYPGGWTTNQDQFIGETELFWEDLSQASLVDGAFPSGGGAVRNCSITDTTQISLSTGAYAVGNFIPAAKVGNGNYVYAYTGDSVPAARYTSDSSTAITYPVNSDNWFGISRVTGTSGNGWTMMSNAGLTVLQAYNIDKKLDDGKPLSGNVVAFFSTGNGIFAPIALAAPSSTTCFDTTLSQYSINQNGGSGMNCALSFRFQ